MRAAAHPWKTGSCEDCILNEPVLHNYEALEKKVTLEELRAILAFPAVHLGRVGDLMGELIPDERDKARHVANFLQSSLALVLKCAKKYREDVLVQVCCSIALNIASNEGESRMRTLWAEGACSIILSAMDMIAAGKTPSNMLPRFYTTHMLVECLITGVNNMYKSPEVRDEPMLPAIIGRLMIFMSGFSCFLAEAIFALSSASAKCPQSKTEIGHAGIDSIITAMQKYRKSEEVQGNGLAALSKICMLNENNTLYVAKRDVLRMFVKLTDMHPKAIRVQVSATQLYTALASGGNLHVKELLVTAGCTRCIVEGMLRFKDIIISTEIADLMTSGIICLTRIVDLLLPNKLKTRVLADGAADAAFYVMSVRRDARSQTSCLVILASMMYDHPENTEAMGMQALSATLGVLRTINRENADMYHIGCPVIKDILKVACDRLSASSSHSDSSDSAAAGGDPLQAKKHASDSAAGGDPLQAKKHASDSAAGGDRLRGEEHAKLVANCRRYQDEFVRCGGVQILMNVLKVKSSTSRTDDLHTDRVTGALQIIEYAVFRRKEIQDMFGEEAIRLLLRMLESYANNSEVQDEVRAAIGALMRDNPDNMTKYVMNGGLEDVLRLQGKSHFDDLETEILRVQVQRLACKEHEEAKLRREREQQQAACVACGKTAEMLGVDKLRMCSACTLAPVYCSVECQRACWKEHKAECKANKKLA
jgi:hypothetical protein